MTKYTLILAAAAILATAGNARADGFAEGIVGFAAPVAEEDYTDAVDASLKLGLRVGAVTREPDAAGIGFELGVDWTPMSSDIDVFATERFHRVRFLGGVRMVYPLSDKMLVTGRFAAGIDYQRATVGGEILGVEFESTETDIGIALDPSLAFQATFGTVAAGLQLGLPIGIHDEQGENFDIDYTSLDFDVLFVITKYVD